MSKPYRLLYKILPVLTAIILIQACKKDELPAPPTGPVTQQEINNWILDSMRYFYLWEQYLPAKADTQPTVTFFNQLKYTDDRFSQIYNPDDLSTYPRYMLYTYGIDFDVIDWPQAPGGAIGVIKFIIPGSAAALQGVKRGSYFTRINGTVLSSSNAASLSEALLQEGEGDITMATIDNNTVTEGELVSLHTQSLAEYPIYAQDIWNVSGKQVGYLFYNAFMDHYNQALLEAFRQFKNAGVSELILDLRYNAGGSVAASALLTALVAPGIDEQSIFIKYSGNARLGQRSISFQSALSVPENGAPIAFSTLASGRLSLPRVFILAGPQTASAAELVINNLQPFTEVILIGRPTFGKDKGAVIIRDERTPKRIPWVLQPITYHLSNASGQGGYTQGITPQYTVNEMAHQPLAPIGDDTDPLIAKAVSIINGNGRQTAPVPATFTRTYFDSRQQPAAGTIVTMPASLLK